MFDDLVEKKDAVGDEGFKEEKVNPFDYIKSINEKRYMWDEKAGKTYNVFLTNKNYSMSKETVYFAYSMNVQIDSKLHYDFLYNVLTKKKRYNKWIKSDKEYLVELISTMYNVSLRKSIDILKILNDEQIEVLKDMKKHVEQ